MAGYAYSTKFPKTSGGAQENIGGVTGNYDAFITRLNSNLTQIIQSTYLGGSKNDTINALAIHPSTGDIYVAGGTSSTDFHKTNGGAQENFGGGNIDAFVVRLSADLAATTSSGSNSGSGSGIGSGSGGSGSTSGGGGGCSMTGSASIAGWWNIFTWLLVPIFVLARKIRRMK